MTRIITPQSYPLYLATYDPDISDAPDWIDVEPIVAWEHHPDGTDDSWPIIADATGRANRAYQLGTHTAVGRTPEEARANLAAQRKTAAKWAAEWAKKAAN